MLDPTVEWTSLVRKRAAPCAAPKRGETGDLFGQRFVSSGATPLISEALQFGSGVVSHLRTRPPIEGCLRQGTRSPKKGSQVTVAWPEKQPKFATELAFLRKLSCLPKDPDSFRGVVWHWALKDRMARGNRNTTPHSEGPGCPGHGLQTLSFKKNRFNH